MVSGDSCEQNGENEESIGCKVKGVTPLDISTSKKGLMSGENQASEKLGANRLKFLAFGSLESPSSKFQRIALERDVVSRGVPSSGSLREQFSKLFKGKIDWNSLQKLCKEWIRNPLNMALCVWILCVAVSGAILFLVMTGMLNHAIRKKSQRDVWFEVNNQILNALFTLMCLYVHPMRFYHLILLVRWKQDDITKLRKAYCKNGTYKPHEWMHMMVVVILLHINCFAQYALCALNVGYRRSKRPAIGVGICVAFAIAAPAIAGLYSSLSPLGKDYNSDFDEEAQIAIAIASSEPETSKKSEFRRKSLERRFSFAAQNEEKTVVTSPAWRGGIMDLWDDISVAYLSLFCTVCVFGWNMGRLGFGNMYVHIATFLLFCLAPFFVFNLAAVNIDNESVREALGIIGLFLCIFGLLYGGFWRIQMRKRFNLPSYNFCFNRPAVTDCVLWLCCCWCSLAQEVRTGNTYDIVDEKFCEKDDTKNLPISPLPHEGGEFQFVSIPQSPLKNSSSQSEIMNARSPSPSRFLKEYTSPGRGLPSVEEESHTTNTDEAMKPPAHSFISREGH